MEDQSPYQASRATPSAVRTDRRDEAPREITSPIMHMWVLLALGAVLTGFGTAVLLLTNPRDNMFLLAVMGVSFAFYAGAAFGVYKRSRVVACMALAMSAVGGLGTLLNIANGQGTLSGVGFTAVLLFVSIRGTLATFRYHRHLRDVRSRPPRPRISDDPAFAPKVDILG